MKVTPIKGKVQCQGANEYPRCKVRATSHIEKDGRTYDFCENHAKEAVRAQLAALLRGSSA